VRSAYPVLDLSGHLVNVAAANDDDDDDDYDDDDDNDDDDYYDDARCCSLGRVHGTSAMVYMLFLFLCTFLSRLAHLH